MNRYKRLLFNTAVFTVGHFAAKLVAFFMLRLYTGILTEEQYGLVDMLFIGAELLAPLLTLGLAEAALRFALDQGSDKTQVLSLSLAITAAGSVVLAALLPLVGMLMPEYRSLLPLFFLYFVSVSLKNILGQFVRGLGRVRDFAVNGVINAAAIAALNVLFLLWLRWAVAGYLLAFTLASLISCAHYFFRAKLWTCVRFRKPDKALLSGMLRYSLPLIPNQLAWWAILQSNRYVTMAYWGLAVSGVLAAAGKIPSIVTMLSGIFQQAWQISSVQEYNSEDDSGFYSGVFKMFSTAVFVCTAALMTIVPWVSKLMLRNDYYSGWVYVPPLLLASAAGCFVSFSGVFYMAAKKTRGSMFSTISGAAANLALCFLLVPRYGAMGAALATLLGYAVMMIYRLIDQRRFVKIRVFWPLWALQFCLIGAQAVMFRLFAERGMFPSVLILALVTALNAKPLLGMARTACGYVKNWITGRSSQA